jgi:hypothetical protein
MLNDVQHGISHAFGHLGIAHLAKASVARELGAI